MILTEKRSPRKHSKVPPSLIYEMMDGKPIYYKGYKSVLNKSKTPEDIIGSSTLQSVLVTYLLSVLIKFLDENNYWILTNEAGIHLNNNNNLAGDILIYEKTQLKSTDINLTYAKVPPNIAIEIDTKADLSTVTFFEYLKIKTTKLHEFGVSKVIWVLTASKQVVVAIPNEDWRLIDWNKDIEIINDIRFNVGNYLSKNGIELPE